MIICPWCGTNYLAHQPNCKNCGAPLPASEVADRVEEDNGLVPPPPAPRPVTNSYVWKMMLSDGFAITGFIFALIGSIFILLGGVLTVFLITAFVGVPFLLMGLFFAAAGAALVFWRYQEKEKIVRVLQVGTAVIGKVINIEENYSVRINHRHPWNIHYEFQANGQPVLGNISTLNMPTRFQAGKSVYVLYLPDNPAINSIYPHP